MVEQSTAASHALAGEAAELSRFVGRRQPCGRGYSSGAAIAVKPTADTWEKF